MNNNGLITAPVAIDGDIAPVLGVSNFNLGYLCSNEHGMINTMSKKKPVIQSSEGELPDSWFADANYGMTLPGTSHVIAAQSDDPVWVYNPPTGGDAAPYRVLDFDGYNHKAPASLLTLNVPANVQVGGQAIMRVAGTINQPDTYNLTYYDMVASLWLSLRATSNPSGSYVEKEIPMTQAQGTGGNFAIEFTASELNSLGAVAGGEIRAHLYARTSSNDIRSARNKSSATTFWTIKCVSSLPFEHRLLNQAVIRDSSTSYLYYLYALYVQLVAVNYQGGTQNAGRIYMFRYVSDGAQYLGNYQPMWESAVPSMTVAAGGMKETTFGTPTSITIQWNGDTADKVVFIWVDGNQQELARLTKNVVEGSKPGV